uniref:Reverse transcriptase domain-containing protein n=1 Tax=Tanacetum cinerariifolium TaxID=118510 RepID=A0A6L2J568_TANCI|nr:hypothetical protein [Tanacetum cinerariifolium]
MAVIAKKRRNKNKKDAKANDGINVVLVSQNDASVEMMNENQPEVTLEEDKVEKDLNDVEKRIGKVDMIDMVNKGMSAERIQNDEVQKENHEGYKFSYAKMVNNNNPNNKLSLIPTEVNDNGIEVVIFDEEIVNEGNKKWELTVCEYFMGYKMSYQEMRYNIFKMWGKYGLKSVIPNGNGIFLFKFKSVEGLKSVTEMGPWMVNGKPIFVQKWDPSVSFDKAEPSALPLLGTPLIMDQTTTNMCNLGNGRPGFARVLVNVEAVKGLPEQVDIVYKNKEGLVTGNKSVNVSYGWAPPLCSHCKIFGHNDKNCGCKPKTIDEFMEEERNELKQNQVNDEFVQVQHRKKGGRKMNSNPVAAEGTKHGSEEDQMNRMNSPKENTKQKSGGSIEKELQCEDKVSEEDDVFEGSGMANSMKVNEVIGMSTSDKQNEVAKFISDEKLQNLKKARAEDETWILKKLDRVMVNEDFMKKYSQAHVIFNPYLVSDHSQAVIIFLNSMKKKKKAFKFANFVDDKDDFKTIVEKEWRTKRDIDKDPYNKALRKEEVAILKDSQKVEGIGKCHSLFKNKVNETEALSLIEDVSSKEIKDALFDIVKEFFKSGKMLKDLNSTVISLIPKTQSPLKVTDYRPIACCNVVYKCISKVITGRSKRVLGNLVNINQSAFVAGRQIHDNILLTQKLLKGYDRKGGPSRVAFKLTYRKLQLIASILESIQVYWCIVFLLPKTVIKEINNLLIGFLWCNGELSRGKAKIAWKKICMPKSHRGLGLKDLEIWNKALLGKLMTWDRITKWGSYDMNVCTLCKENDESHDHLFFKCNFSQTILRTLKPLMQFKSNANKWNNIIEELVEKPNNNSIWSIVRRLCLDGAVGVGNESGLGNHRNNMNGQIDGAAIPSLVITLGSCSHLSDASEEKTKGALATVGFAGKSFYGLQYQVVIALRIGSVIEGGTLFAGIYNDESATSFGPEAFCWRIRLTVLLPCAGFLKIHLIQEQGEIQPNSCLFGPNKTRPKFCINNLAPSVGPDTRNCLEKMSTMANTTPIVTTVTKIVTKEKTPNGAKAASRVNIVDFCEEHYEDILPVMDKIRRVKRKEVHTRLDFGENSRKNQRMREDSQNSSAKTLEYSRDGSYSRGRPYKRDSSPSRDRSHDIEESCGNTYPFYRTGDKHRYHSYGTWRSSSMKRGRNSESSLSRMSKSCTSEGGHWKSNSKRRNPIDEEDLAASWLCEEVDLFTPRILNLKSSRKTRMPNNVKTYDGTGDLEDHVKKFQAATQVECWAMPTWCHMFNSILIGTVRICSTSSFQRA